MNALKAVLVGTLLFALAAPALATETIHDQQDRKLVVDTEFLGEVVFPTGLIVDDTELGGLSALVFDAHQGVYYALSDDRSDARFYQVAIDLEDGTLDDGDIVFTTVTRLIDQNGEGFADGVIDPEGLVLTDGKLLVSSEGDASAEPPIDPFIRPFDLDGQPLGEGLPVPEKYLPTADGTRGIRNNLAFESLTLTPNGRELVTALENALAQDGPAADIDQPSLARVLRYDLKTGHPIDEVVYPIDAVPDVPDPADAFRTNGLVEMLATDNNGTFLALERAFSVGVGNTVRLYEVLSQGALDVSGVDDLFDEENDIPFEIDPPVQKRLLVDFGDLPLSTVDNLEALAFGPTLPDGRQTLIVTSDNNFNDSQVTQFIALALDFKTIPAVKPIIETADAADDAEAETPLQGDSDDPAIYIHPQRPSKSLVIATQKDGGLAVFDLHGRTLQVILPAAFGDIRYNNVDLVYGFDLGGHPVDLAVASDRANDSLAIFQINPKASRLHEVTSPLMLDTIFGVDDGEATAYGLATYESPKSGRVYAYVTQADGAAVAQLELLDDGHGGVTAEVVRLLDLPVPTGDPEDSQSEGIVADREHGLLYVSLEEEVGVLRFGAEPEDGSGFDVVIPIDHPALSPDLEGLTIFYGADGAGVLIVSSQGDSSLAVFERGDGSEDELAFLGSVVIGSNEGSKGDIDQVNESDGLDVTNVRLKKNFRKGLLVVQDGANDPQIVVPDEEELENSATNFKFVPWEKVAKRFSPPLPTNVSSFNPRQN